MAAIVILAGGKSRRMGRDKLALHYDGSTLLERSVTRFSEHFETVVISVSDANKYPDINAARVVDLVPGAGPLSGLHAALITLPEPGVFLTAADLPFSSPLAAKHIAGLCGSYSACVIKLENGRLEPLFGYYSKKLLPRCEAALESRDYRMSQLLHGTDVRFISPQELGGLWEERMLLNINYPEDYDKICK